MGADRGCECVGYQAHDPQGEEDPQPDAEQADRSVRFTGGIGVVGVFVPQDPGGADELGQQGKCRSTSASSGSRARPSAPASARSRHTTAAPRSDRRGQGQPVFIVSHELPLEQAPRGLPALRRREHGWTKVVLKPGSGE